MRAEKIPTVKGSAAAIRSGIGRILGGGAGGLASFIHGSTIATNTWLTRSGADSVLLVTRGYRDVLEIGDQRRPHLYRLDQARPPALVPRSRVIEVEERIGANGDIVIPLTGREITRVLAALDGLRFDSVAISLLFGHLNPAHEAALAEAVAAVRPGCPVYCSHEINPEIGEFQRANTTAVAAYVGPEMGRYLEALEAGLREDGFAAPLLLMRSDGGVATLEAALRNPLTMLLSGPSGGVVASLALARTAGLDNLLTFDMGGTSADFSIVAEGQASLSQERIIDGQVLRTPMIDIKAISAGGGSLARVDHAGRLHVGPQSAGAQPGPACFGRGGTQPALTDALAALGILDPADFSAGDIRLAPEKAVEAIRTQVANPLGIGVEEAAHGMIGVASTQMRQAMRALAISKGRDLRDFSLLAFGGAGAIFAAFMAEELGIARVLVPPRAGVFSAFGLLLADMRHQHQQAFMSALDDPEEEALREALARLRARIEDAFDRDAVPAERRIIQFSADLRYVGQHHHAQVPCALRADGLWDAAAMSGRFHDIHERTYGHADRAGEVECVNLRVEGVGVVGKPSFPRLAHRAGAPAVPCGSRAVALGLSPERTPCPVYARETLLSGHRIPGPAIVTQSDTTILLLPGQSGSVDEYGVIHIRRVGDEG